jgi:peptide/nickel transport system ATP-binding protein
MTDACLLTIRDLWIEGLSGGRWQPIVKGVGLHLRRGEVLGLIGESGAGKSTLGLAAMGYTRPGCRIKAGTIEFDGIMLHNAPERELRGARITYVAQSAAATFNPAHRLLRQYTEAPVQHGLMSVAEAQRNAREIYSRLGLPDPERFGKRFPHQVSGGQLQRAMVATALACRPDLVVFDEPTTALDVTTQIEVLAAIKEIVGQLDTAALYISHDLAVVAQLADRIMVLRDGALVEEGAVRLLLASPRTGYTRELLGVRKVSKAETPVLTATEDAVLAVANVSAGYTNANEVLHDSHLAMAWAQRIAELLAMIELPATFAERYPSCPAARSSASASPARSPPSRI